MLGDVSFLRTCTFREDEDVAKGLMMYSVEALNTVTVDMFLDVLLKREAWFTARERCFSEMSRGNSARLVVLEKVIRERLENERDKLIKEIDALTRQIRTAKAYSAIFPFPSAPVFLDRTG
jgi:hypothetical protein